mgnify:FL=1
MIPGFVAIKLSKGTKPRGEVVLIYNDKGWKARAFYYADPGSSREIGSGPESLSKKEAESKAKELASEFRKSEERKRTY